MSHVSEAIRTDTYYGYINPKATDAVNAQARTQAVADTFVTARTGDLILNDGFPTPEDIASRVSGYRTLVNADGGDGTVRGVVAAALGIVEDDAEASAQNLTRHSELIKDVLLFANAGGNGNNFQLSAHQKFAAEPWKLKDADGRLVVAEHRPLIYQILDEHDEIVKSGIALTGLGVGGSAVAAREFDRAKPKLNELKWLKGPRRIAHEALITLNAIKSHPSFGLQVERTSANETDTILADKAIQSYEFIGSHVYAKRGKTRVNVDDTRWQPLVAATHSRASVQVAALLNAALQMNTARQPEAPIEMDGTSLILTPRTEVPVPIHADGETGDSLVIEPDQKLKLQLAKLAIPFVLVR